MGSPRKPLIGCATPSIAHPGVLAVFDWRGVCLVCEAVRSATWEQGRRADRAEARVAALTEAVEGLRKDHDAQRRIGVLGPDGHAGAWAALGAVLGFLEGKPIAPPPFDYEDYVRRRAAEAATTPPPHTEPGETT